MGSSVRMVTLTPDNKEHEEWAAVSGSEDSSFKRYDTDETIGEKTFGVLSSV